MLVPNGLPCSLNRASSYFDYGTEASPSFFSYSANRGENRGIITKTALIILAASLAANLVVSVTAVAEGECQQDREKFCKAETRANIGACPKPPNAQSSNNPPS